MTTTDRHVTRRQHPAHGARVVVTSVGLAAVLALAGVMGYGDLRARIDEVAASAKPTATPQAIAAQEPSRAPTTPAGEQPIRLKAHRVVKTVTVGGGGSSTSSSVGGTTVVRTRTAPAPASAPVVTTSGSN